MSEVVEDDQFINAKATSCNLFLTDKRDNLITKVGLSWSWSDGFVENGLSRVNSARVKAEQCF